MRLNWFEGTMLISGPTMAIEVLLEKHSIRVGRATLRRWMVAVVSGSSQAA
jgi:hypothetical protein